MRMDMFQVCTFFLLMFLAVEPGTVLADSTRPEMGKYGKAFKGTEGEIVEIARLGPVEAAEFLIKISRVDHPWDGKIWKAKAINAGNGLDYSVESADGRLNVIVERGQASAKSYQLYLEGSSPIELRYDEALSKESLPEHLLTEYLEQQKPKRRR